MVGVNKFRMEESAPLPAFRLNEAMDQCQRERLCAARSASIALEQEFDGAGSRGAWGIESNQRCDEGQNWCGLDRWRCGILLKKVAARFNNALGN